MSKPFLIAGTPRSRTAWLAAVCNMVPGALCLHEPVAWCPPWRNAVEMWGVGGYDYIGISDSGLSFHLAEIIDRWAPQILLVDRIKPEVDESMLRAFGTPKSNFCDLLTEALLPFRHHPLVRSVPFEILGQPGVVQGLIQHLMPGAAVDLIKLRVMERLNVQINPGQMLKSVADMAAPTAADLIGAHAAARLVLAEEH